MPTQDYTTVLGGFMDNLKLRLIGVDPHDSHPMMRGWKIERSMPKSEVAILLNIPEAIRDKDYMWVNHGFFVMDLMTEYSPDKVQADMHGIYLCDGKYYLIRKL